jgi:trigger factor
VPYTEPQASEEQIAEVLKSLQERHAMMEPAGEGPAEMGQVAVLDIEGKLGAEENAEPFMHEHEAQLMVSETTDFPFPGFVQHIVGMKAGEEKSFEMVVPDTDDDEALRGKTVDFKVKLQDLKVRTVPPLDDAFAQTVGAFETLDALRGAIRASQLQQAKQEADSRYSDECLLKLVEQATIEFPSQMADEELDRLIERTERRLKDQKMSLDEFLNIKKQSREQYRAEMRPRAESNVRRGLAMSELAIREGLTVTRDELTVMINMLSAGYGEEADRVRESLSTDESRQSLSVSMLSDKVVARLVSICKGENPPLPAEQEKAKEPAPAAETLAAGEAGQLEQAQVSSEGAPVVASE